MPKVRWKQMPTRMEFQNVPTVRNACDTCEHNGMDEKGWNCANCIYSPRRLNLYVSKVSDLEGKRNLEQLVEVEVKNILVNNCLYPEDKVGLYMDTQKAVSQICSLFSEKEKKIAERKIRIKEDIK